jgi:DNA-binding GntR family transcriptional regulator
MRDANRQTTVSAYIYEVLRGRIVSLDLPPGAVLQEKEFAEEFGVSRTPAREALLRLAEEQLVDIYPQSSTLVAPIRISLVKDAMVIRDALERYSAHAAAERADALQIAALDAIINQQRIAAASDDNAAFHAADETMHQTIAVISGHPNIWRVVKREKANVDRMRLLSLRFEGRFESVITQHCLIIEAIRGHSPEAAEAAMHAHLGRVLPSLEAMQARYPTYFENEAAPRARERRFA